MTGTFQATATRLLALRRRIDAAQNCTACDRTGYELTADRERTEKDCRECQGERVEGKEERK